MTVVVVTDSSARLDPDELKRWDIRVVPLHVLQDGIDYLDGVDPIPQDIQDRSHVSTSGAAPGDLTDVYRQALADSGGDGVVAVHLSAGLSSTFSSAAAVGRELGSAVRVINSRSAAMGVGFVALAAARAAAAGADLDTVEALARAIGGIAQHLREIELMTRAHRPHGDGRIRRDGVVLLEWRGRGALARHAGRHGTRHGAFKDEAGFIGIGERDDRIDQFDTSRNDAASRQRRERDVDGGER